jgi:flagellar basal-body rod protein FlgC
MQALEATMRIAVSGLDAQTARIRTVAQNMANAQSTSTQPGGDPYRRQIISFESEFSRQLNAQTVAIDEVDRDDSDFPLKYRPEHPAANADGYVAFPNVNPLIEAADMREAVRSYEANLSMMENARTLYQSTVDLMRRF